MVLQAEPLSLAIVALVVNWTGILVGAMNIVAYWKRRNVFPASIVFNHFLALEAAGIAVMLNFVNGYSLSPPSAFCTAQGIAINYTFLAGALWTCIHVFNIWSYVVRSARAAELRKNARYYFIIGWGFPLIPTIATFSFVDAEMIAMWCWIRSPLYARMVAIYFYMIPLLPFVFYYSIMIAKAIFDHRKAVSAHTEVGGNVSVTAVARIAFLSLAYCVTGGGTTAVRTISWLRDESQFRSDQSDPVGASEIGSGLFTAIWSITFFTTPTIWNFYKELIFGRPETGRTVTHLAKKKIQGLSPPQTPKKTPSERAGLTTSSSAASIESGAESEPEPVARREPSVSRSVNRIDRYEMALYETFVSDSSDAEVSQVAHSVLDGEHSRHDLETVQLGAEESVRDSIVR